MSNVATISFKIAPDRYAVLKALALSEGVSVSEFVRRTVEEALDLERQMERLADFFGERTLGDRLPDAERVEL